MHRWSFLGSLRLSIFIIGLPRMNWKLKKIRFTFYFFVYHSFFLVKIFFDIHAFFLYIFLFLLYLFWNCWIVPLIYFFIKMDSFWGTFIINKEFVIIQKNSSLQLFFKYNFFQLLAITAVKMFQLPITRSNISSGIWPMTQVTLTSNASIVTGLSTSTFDFT